VNKKVLVIAVALLAVSLLPSSLVSTAQAKITEVNPAVGYTEYYGTMGGANFYVLIPDDWTNPLLGDGMLVVLCRPAAYSEDPRGNVPDYPFALGLAMQGIAVAASNYGPSGSGVKEGVIRTHQLTMYVIDNYDVTGKVFLFGSSLGGCVALLLGEGHPEVYSGVLDNSGIKDWAAIYNDAASYSGSDPFLLLWNEISISSYEDNYGGTPEERPNKYAKYSPTHHADMAIPVISVVHVGDMIVKPEQTELYHAALSDPSLHTVVYVTDVTPGNFPFPGATGWYGHFDPATFTAAATNLVNLIVWSNTLDP
jgi:pimeloyl-ACP methyl ester carboxylesterase